MGRISNFCRKTRLAPAAISLTNPTYIRRVLVIVGSPCPRSNGSRLIIVYCSMSIGYQDDSSSRDPRAGWRPSTTKSSGKIPPPICSRKIKHHSTPSGHLFSHFWLLINLMVNSPYPRIADFSRTPATRDQLIPAGPPGIDPGWAPQLQSGRDDHPSSLQYQ